MTIIQVVQKSADLASPFLPISSTQTLCFSSKFTMAECPPNSRTMVVADVERAAEDEVQVWKQVCQIGHSFVRRLRDNVDASQVLDRDFCLDTVRTAWLWMVSKQLGCLKETGLDFVLDYCPDLVVLHVMDNDLDASGPVDRVVQGHVDFVVQLSVQMGDEHGHLFPIAQTEPTVHSHGAIQIEGGGVR